MSSTVIGATKVEGTNWSAVGAVTSTGGTSGVVPGGSSYTSGKRFQSVTLCALPAFARKPVAQRASAPAIVIMTISRRRLNGTAEDLVNDLTFE
jgi:hypothetical protein